MNIYRSLEDAPADFGPSALTIGNFDGVHCGHRRILRRLVALASANGWKPSVLTFDPHPTRVVAPERAPRLLTTPDRRAALMEEEGIAQVLILPFTPEFARMTPEEFARDLLARRLRTRVVLVGENFRFGHRHAGDAAMLAALGRELGFDTQVVRAVRCRGRVVSSSAVREAVAAGLVSLAARFLGKPFALEGSVVSGRGVGSKQTVPTLNLDTSAEVLPARGVYITRTRDCGSGRKWRSITNIGTRPTFGAGGEATIETYLLDPLEDSTPRRIEVAFLRRVRDERMFDSPAALKEQILRDVAAARSYFRRLEKWTGREGQARADCGREI
jgi:riboflavin kinase/FMN adenylyltransferase